jgi:hypothetical protein
MIQKSRLALYFGNRGFFPASLQAEAREVLPRVLEAAGRKVLMLDAEATRYGANLDHFDRLYHVAPLKKAFEKYLGFDVTIQQVE